jgi:hypothetical protein
LQGHCHSPPLFFRTPKVHNDAEVFIRLLKDFFTANKRSEFFIGIIDNHFVFEGQRLFGPTVVGRQLISFMALLRCGGISFSEHVTVEAVSRFMDLTDRLKTPLGSLGEARDLFKQHGLDNITLSGHYNEQPQTGLADGKKAWEGEETGGFLQSPTLVYQAVYDVVSRAHGDASYDRQLDIDSARSVSEFMLRFTQSNFADVMQYIHYPDYDSYTVGHSVRVSSLAVYMGMQLGWPEEDILEMATAAILHDIGKSKLTSEILYKTKALDEGRVQTGQGTSPHRRGVAPRPEGRQRPGYRRLLGTSPTMGWRRLSGPSILGPGQPGH